MQILVFTLTKSEVTKYRLSVGVLRTRNPLTMQSHMNQKDMTMRHCFTNTKFSGSNGSENCFFKCAIVYHLLRNSALG